MQSIPTIGKFLTATAYAIVSGSRFDGIQYGGDVWMLTSEMPDPTNNCSIIFNQSTREVYEVRVSVANDTTIWVNPRWSVRDHNSVDSFDQLIDIIKQHRQPPLMETIPLDISDQLLLMLTKQAHDEDITLNELMTSIILEIVDCRHGNQLVPNGVVTRQQEVN